MKTINSGGLGGTPDGNGSGGGSSGRVVMAKAAYSAVNVKNQKQKR